MPGEIDGIALYKWIERAQPDLARRCLFVTGDLEPGRMDAVIGAHPERVITKPFTRDEYLARVLALFDEVAQPNVSLLDVSGAEAHFERHQWGHRPDSHSNSWLAAIFLPTRQGEEYLSTLDLGRGETQDLRMGRSNVLFGMVLSKCRSA
jgi:DNA-binding NarL/FixJ family response regulator